MQNKATVNPWFITSLNMLMCTCYGVLLIQNTSPYHINAKLSWLMAKEQIYRSHSHRVYLSEENLIEYLNIKKENRRV